MENAQREAEQTQGKMIGLSCVCVFKMHPLLPRIWNREYNVLKARVILYLTQQLPHKVFLFFISEFGYDFSPSDQLFPPSNCFKIGSKNGNYY